MGYGVRNTHRASHAIVKALSAGAIALSLAAMAWSVAGGVFDVWTGKTVPNISASYATLGPAVAVSEQGEAWAVWGDDRTDDTPAQDVYYARSADGGFHWGSPLRLAPALSDVYNPSLTASGDTAWIVWAEGFDATLYQATVTPTDTQILVIPTDHRRFSTYTDIERAGDWLYVALQGMTDGLDLSDVLISRRRLSDTSWPTATVVYTGTVTWALSPHLAVQAENPTHTLHLVWQGQTGSLQSYVYYMRGTTTGGAISWSPAITLSGDIVEAILPIVAVAADGDVHVAWSERLSGAERRVYYRRWDAATQSWMAMRSVTDVPILVNTLNPTIIEPALALPETGDPDTVCVAWHGCWISQCVEEIWLSCSEDDGQTWSGPANVSRTPGEFSHFPVMVFDGEGHLHFVWQETSPQSAYDYSVFYARSLPNVVFLPSIFRW